MKKFYVKKEKKIKNKYLDNNNKLLTRLLKSNSHYGAPLKNSHPNSLNYVYGIRSKQTIFNLEYTIQSLKRSLLLVEKVLQKNNKLKILVVCNDLKTKLFKEELTDNFLQNRIEFIDNKWSGGFITNPILLGKRLKNIGLIISFNEVKDNLLIKEAIKANIPLISVADTTINSNLIDYPIMINNNNIKSTFFLIFLFKKYLSNLNYENK